MDPSRVKREETSILLFFAEGDEQGTMVRLNSGQMDHLEHRERGNSRTIEKDSVKPHPYTSITRLIIASGILVARESHIG